MENCDKLTDEQVYDIITGKELSWQTIIYDLIRTEQLDPLDLDIGRLAERYLEVIERLEEMDFFISSKVLLACSLLLRLKSEVLVNNYIKDLDEALYGGSEEKPFSVERIEIDENELPVLNPRTPLARSRRVTLTELIAALDKAINTEHRRIKREIKESQAKKSISFVLPKSTFIPLKVRIRNIFKIISSHFSEKEEPLPFSKFAESKEEKIASFVPVLHLANSKKIYLWQENHFEEIHITLDIHPMEKSILERELERIEEPTEPQK